MNSTGGVRAERRGGSWPALAGVLALLFLALAGLAVRGQDPTLDERFYFGTGREILASGEWRGRGARLHPPLGYYVSSLPLLAFEEPSAWQPLPLFLSRLASLLVFGVPLLATLYAWARERGGAAAGALAMALAAGSPTLRAHAALITPDWPLTATSLLTLFLFWRAELRQDRPRSGSPFGWGGALGLCLLAKGAGWVIAGCLVALSAIAAVRRRDAGPLRRSALGLAMAWLVLQLGYGFSGWLDLGGKAELLARVPAEPAPRLLAGLAALLFPLPYLKTMATQLHVARDGVPAFLMGELSDGGFFHYFVVALLVKETLPLLLLLAAAFFALTRRPQEGDLVLLLPALAFLVVFSLSRVQIGIRYLLPAFPLLCVHASRLVGLAATRSRLAATALTALVGLHLVCGMRAWPDDLAYFNEIAGGPESGWRWLVDSNLDWGQNRSRMEQAARREGWMVEPLILPPAGRVVVGANRLQGLPHRTRYRRLREEYEPVDRVGFNFLVFDLSRPRHPRSAVTTVLSGDGWMAAASAAELARVVRPARPLEPDPGFVPEREYPGTEARLMGCPEGAAGCVLRTSFELNRPPIQAVLHLAARDALELAANGRPVVSVACAPAFASREDRLDGELRRGLNELQLRLSPCDGRSASGVFVEMRVIEAPAP